MVTDSPDHSGWSQTVLTARNGLRKFGRLWAALTTRPRAVIFLEESRAGGGGPYRPTAHRQPSHQFGNAAERRHWPRPRPRPRTRHCPAQDRWRNRRLAGQRRVESGD